MDVTDPGPGSEVTLAHEQDLGQPFSTLPVELRECLLLRELDDLSRKDIAQITGVPMGTEPSRLSRARQTLARTAA